MRASYRRSPMRRRFLPSDSTRYTPGGASTRPSSPPMTTKVWDVVSVEVGGYVAVGLVVGDVAACGGESVAAGCSSPPPHATGSNASDMIEWHNAPRTPHSSALQLLRQTL